MTVPPTRPRQVRGSQALPVQALLMEQPNQTKATVEIETMARGIPKIKVRVNDDNPDEALELALTLYFEAQERLELHGLGADTKTTPPEVIE